MFPVVPAGKKPKSLPAFIVGQNGIFLRKQSALGITQAKVDGAHHLPALEPELDYALPSIPASVSGQIAGFLLMVWKQRHTEGAVLLCLDENKAWQIVIPRQKVSGADVDYFVDEGTVPEGWTLMGTCHSHPFSKLAPKASVTDENDERKFDGVHLVAGDPSIEGGPKYSAVVVSDGTRWTFHDSGDVIESAAPVEVPEEWMEKVEKQSWTSKVVNSVVGGGSGSSSGGSSYGKNSWTLGPREGETPQQAIARYDATQIKFLTDDAKKLGFEFKWELVPLPEKAEASEPPLKVTMTGGPKAATVKVYDSDEGDWKQAELIECEGKHPYQDCKKNCGCHCGPCKKGLVGSFSSKVDKDDEVLLCSCTVCWEGCDTTVSPDDVMEGQASICILCKEGTHYKDMSQKVGEA